MTKGVVTVLPAADVLATLKAVEGVTATVLDPWYNKGVGESRPDYQEWLLSVVELACKASAHTFLWGFPEILARQIPTLPSHVELVAWLTWYYKNCPSVIRGWRSAQNACLHLSQKGAKVYPENFLNSKQKERFRNNKMRFIPGPPSVLEAPLNIGFVGRDEQTGYPAQKPISVIAPLVLMATKPGDTVLDPMCGSGTTAVVCAQHGRRAIVCDASEEALQITKLRISSMVSSNGR